VASADGFDGGALRRTLPIEETHEETLARVLRTREANVGRAMSGPTP
jgi:hypothetical protein